MNLIKRFALVVAVSVVPVASYAAGFTGPYAGAQVGQVSGKDDGVEYLGGTPDGWVQHSKPKGTAFGVLGGYNWALNDNMLLGVDGDLESRNVSGQTLQTTNGTNTAWLVHTKVKYALAIRARFGYVFNDRTMAYVAAGLANAKIERSYSTYAPVSVSQTGLTFGLGAEQSIADKISLRLEYRYTDYGSADINISTYLEKQKYKEQSLLFGADYHF